MTIRDTLSKSDTDSGIMCIQCYHFITCVDSCTTTVKGQKDSTTQRSISEAPLTAYWEIGSNNIKKVPGSWGGAANVSQPYDFRTSPGSNRHAFASCFVLVNPHVPLLRSGGATLS